PTDALGNWPDLLLNALDEELDGKEGRFNGLFEELLEEAQSEGASLDEFQRVVSVLRAEFQRTSRSEEDSSRLERIWHDARVLVGAASIRLLGRQKIDQQIANSRLGWVGERLATTLSLPLLKKEIFDGLAQLQISRGAVSLHSHELSGQLKTLVIKTDDGEPGIEDGAFPETELAPRALFDTASCQHFVALPITFETEMLGLAVFAGDAQSSVYEPLRQQIGSAIKGAMLHREMVAHVASRAQLEADRVAKEARIAAVIQTSINPVFTEIPGLEVAALMVPAAEAGGDYYDVIATARGAWIGIGDVTGHGLGAGLIMLMIQSMIAGLTRMQPAPSPSQVVSTVGDALWDSVRLRLKRDDHATLTVLHYQGSGRFTFAGAHEDLIVWRSRTGRCELVPTPGFWVGALPSVRHMTQDSELVLSPGDLLILHTDGITEARNTRHEQFSLERLVRYIEELARQPAAVIRDRVQEAVSSWSASLDDDVTLLVVRYLGEGSAAG
ncbi:MAG TPA: SpoIIE family protein phosphatase, partial [Polyangiaceae bacterium]|nr:SpoIIE family protein phosphatase [Polyangiaceae bacterium]